MLLLLNNILFVRIAVYIGNQTFSISINIRRYVLIFMTSCTDCPNSGNKKDELSALVYFTKEMQMIKRNTIQKKFLRNFLEIKGRVGRRRNWIPQLVFLRHVGRAICSIPAIKQNFLKCCATVKKFLRLQI